MRVRGVPPDFLFVLREMSDPTGDHWSVSLVPVVVGTWDLSLVLRETSIVVGRGPTTSPVAFIIRLSLL